MEGKGEKILIVEDENVARKNLSYVLKKMGYTVVESEDGEKALEMLKNEEYDLVITDLKMPSIDGMDVLQESKKLHPFTEVIVITGYATIDTAVQAMKEGAYHYISKPLKLDEIRMTAKEAILKRKLMLENMRLKSGLKSDIQVPFLIGKSEALQQIKKTIIQIAPSNTNVLIYGESGTGKELIARAIHSLSKRAENKFVAFNCGSFTEELMANELFGHEKGAFTGANQLKRGLLETANKGTVFLDEIGDMPLTMQIKLLRVIQEREILRVGGTKPIPVDVRFMGATHRDLKKDVEQGLFRQDLYYRLNVISIFIPPLASRKEDIPLLAYHFLALKSSVMQKEIHDISKEAMDLLIEYSWPGNVRELENVIERAVALQNESVIQVEDLPDYIRNMSVETYRHEHSSIPTLEEQERKYIEWILKKFDYNKSRAANAMNIDRVTLWRKLKKYGIE